MEHLAARDEVGCPQVETLVQFAQGAVTPHALEDLADHVAACSRCCVILDRLFENAEEEGLVGEIKLCFRSRRTPKDERVDRLAASARVVQLEPTTPEVPDRRALSKFSEEKFEPRQMGAYRLLDIIGRGGMGIVYRAEQTSLRRQVAVKMILGGAHAAPQSVRRFHTEKEAIARLKHPHVVQIHDFGEHEGQPFFSMELMEGGNLAQRLAQGSLEWREAAIVVHTLAETVAAAHERGVLHRDLKPANVLLTGAGDMKISDFGLAKILDENGEHTQSEAIIGTPSYMAPEQADGTSKTVGPAADVYALGAILYETLTGVPPFKGRSAAHTRLLVRTTQAIRPSRLRPEVPRDLEAICLKCLEKAPERRYQTAQAMADDLRVWLDGGRPQGIPGRLRTFWRTWRRVALASLLGIVVALALAFSPRSSSEDPEQALRDLLRSVEQEKSATLIGAAGSPKWFRIRTDADMTKVTENSQGIFSVYTPSLCLVELLPKVKLERYRFKCQVRHRDSNGKVGEVGLYVAHRSFPGTGEPWKEAHLFMQLYYNDVVRLRAGLGKLNPKISELNSVRLMAHMHGEIADNPGFDNRTNVLTGVRFEPAGIAGLQWRDLEIVVMPESIQAFWDGNPTGAISLEKINEEIGSDLQRIKKSRIGQKDVDSIVPQISVDGGLGLYVYHSSASFRNASITPVLESELTRP